MRVHASLPEAAAELDPAQRAFLADLADAIGDAPASSGDAWQTAIFVVSKEAGLPSGRAFDAIYRAFLGRPNGPRAGWLLAGLDPAFVAARLREASQATAVGGVA